ncbi:MAG: hypothetical protein M8350_02005 [Methanosarcinaceae archaeon]|nr:hypothetical protein [Methanosarcinaceae archaeon]
MSDAFSFDYIDNDPLVLITLFNPVSKKKESAYAYLDTGSDAIVVPRDIWLKLGLEMLNRANVSAVGGVLSLLGTHGYIFNSLKTNIRMLLLFKRMRGMF